LAALNLNLYDNDSPGEMLHGHQQVTYTKTILSLVMSLPDVANKHTFVWSANEAFCCQQRRMVATAFS